MVSISNDDCHLEFIYARIEDYVRDVFDSSLQDTYNYDLENTEVMGNIIYAVDYENHDAISSFSTIYNSLDDTQVDVLSQIGALKGLAVPLYMVAAQDENMVPIANDDDIDTLRCYRCINKNDQITYQRVYSAAQIAAAQEADTDYCSHITAKKFKYLMNTYLETTNFTPNTNIFNVDLYLCSLVKNDTGDYSIVAQRYAQPHTLDFSSAAVVDGIKTITVSLEDDEGNTYTSDINYSSVKKESLVNITNGTFWYRYRTHIE